MKNNLLFLMCGILISTNVFAASSEFKNPLETTAQVSVLPEDLRPTDKDERPVLTPEIESKLAKLLDMQDYGNFFALVEKYNGRDPSLEKFLEKQASNGHIPVFWLLANYYAVQSITNKNTSAPVVVNNALTNNINIEKNNHDNIINTHKWLYIATISTQQDSYLCTDNSARSVTKILNTYFNFPVDVARDTPQFTENAMSQTIFFLDNLKVRQDPTWICKSYGSVKKATNLQNTNRITLPKEYWSAKRKEVLKSLTHYYQK